MGDSAPQVGVIMGSQSDWPTMAHAVQILEEFGIAHDVHIVSAHRTPDRLVDYAKGAATRGLKAIIAGAGGAAHLPGMTASKTTLPVLGVPVATFAIGKAGATNAGLFAAALLANNDANLAQKLDAWRETQTNSVAPTPVREG